VIFSFRILTRQPPTIEFFVDIDFETAVFAPITLPSSIQTPFKIKERQPTQILSEILYFVND